MPSVLLNRPRPASEGIFSRGTSHRFVKVVYCDHCADVSIKSRFENDTCTTCGRVARVVPHTRPWQYFASTAILLTATAVLILGPTADWTIRLAIFGSAFAVALLLSVWSIQSMRSRILRMARGADPPGAKP